MPSEIKYGAGEYGEYGYGGLLVTKEASVSVELEEKGNLTVTVNDTGGNPISDASVSISGTSSNTATTDSSGVAEFSGISVGDYTVEVEKEGYFSATSTVSASDFT